MHPQNGLHEQFPEFTIRYMLIHPANAVGFTYDTWHMRNDASHSSVLAHSAAAANKILFVVLTSSDLSLYAHGNKAKADRCRQCGANVEPP